MKLRPNFLWSFPAFCALAAWSASLFAADLPKEQETVRMLKQGNFSELEKIATDLRNEKLRFYVDRPKLTEFYDQLDLSRQLDDKAWNDHIARLQAWAKAFPDSPTPLVALATVYTSYAWKARGNGYANTVTDRAWQLFGERLRQAKEYLEKADQLPVKDPEVYREGIIVAMGLSDSKAEMEAIYQKGLAVNPDYVPLYEAKAHYLLPRWLGHPGDWEAFARQAADARGGEEGDLLYLIIARSEADTEGDNFFRHTTFSYQRLKKGFEASLKLSPNDLWELNSYCYFACIAGDRSGAKSLFQKIDGRMEPSVWEDERHFQAWHDWAMGSGRLPGSRPAPSAPMDWNKIKPVVIAGSVLWVGILAVVFGAIWLISRKSRKAG